MGRKTRQDSDYRTHMDSDCRTHMDSVGMMNMDLLMSTLPLCPYDPQVCIPAVINTSYMLRQNYSYYFHILQYFLLSNKFRHYLIIHRESTNMFKLHHWHTCNLTNCNQNQRQLKDKIMSNKAPPSPHATSKHVPSFLHAFTLPFFF